MTDAVPALEDLFRHEAGKICAWLVRLLGPGRLELIEDAVQDAFSAALAQWRFEGTPQRPAAWLAIAARNKALDRLRRETRLESLDPNDEAAAWRLGFANPQETGKPDDTLALMFVACHPALSDEEQTMLTLQAVCGFNARQIARAFLATPEAVTQRLVRAKRRLRDLKLTVEIPEGTELAGRLAGLLNAIYLLFTGGYTAAEGERLMAEERCAEALRLVTILCEHPGTATAETHALAALICLHHARTATRTGARGDIVLLAEQDRARWDATLLARGFGHLRRAMAATELTALHLEAGIAAVHASAPSFAQTDWVLITALYDELARLTPSPVVELNRAVAVSMAYGPAAGLEMTDRLAAQGALRSYHLLPSVRGDLLARLGRYHEARGEFERAATLTRNTRESRLLLDRAAACLREEI